MPDSTGLGGLRAYPLARRGMMMTGLVSGFTLATQRVEARAIHTDTQGLDAGEARIPVPDGALPAYFARPAGKGPFPVVLVNEEIFGVHEYIRDVCRRLAKAGYFAVATEYYARVGDLSKMTDVRQIIRDVIAKAPDNQYMADMDATAAWALQHGGDAGRVGVIGFCRGGRQTWLYAAHSPHLKAAVAFYGPLGGTPSSIQPQTALDVADRIRCPLLGLYGGQDPGTPVAMTREAEARAKAAHRTVEIVIYPDAPHGFHADYRPSYRQADAADAWARMLAWFRRFGMAPAG
ncbi:dienelactone hydrolase family protein [Rhodopila globiformis]|uniref:Carboxymethylenebutenolidase n=1 Tax=Rhodopila globiformis TaxID=1071 RepID=A0A2S6N3F1_RHOGL|nr:dienelactone hydrolase family protein [Rhodopila globiformis]PPQ29144.1 carboxymethylenebutenolidase [Rhodopila globiformis]